MKLAFAGTPDFARMALQGLVAAGHDLVLVLTQPDRAAGRGLKLQASPVKQFALAHGLPLAQPRSLRLEGKYPDDAQAARAALLRATPDLMVVAAYGLLLPPWVLTLPVLGCLNIHGSLLPRWRGAAPIQRAIEAGDGETGITIMQMDAGLDTGDMLLREGTPITADDTTTTLHHRLAEIGARLIVQTVDLAGRGALRSLRQPEAGVNYAHKIQKAEARIDWTAPAEVLERRVRAFDPFPGCSTALGGQELKVWRTRTAAGQGPPGQVLQADDEQLVVACGTGALQLLELQLPGGRRIGAREFLRGHTLAPGTAA